MNRSTVHALALDALHQVLDNWVFRILTGLTLVPILLTFVIGAREEGIVLLFGLKTWAYADLPAVGPMLALTADPQGLVIETLLQLFFVQAAGNLGTLLSICATAFFVPRLLEKGAADLYFHKPVSRATLYLSRYGAGLLFIALTSGVLSLGIFLGLATASQRVDPGVLLACPTLVYMFALVFPFTMLVGVVTRSTVASILLSAMFFLFNGCIQQAWISLEQLEHGPNMAALVRRGAESEGDSEEEEAPLEETRKGARDSAFGRALLTSLDLVRTTLPKTSDADHFARKLRARLSAPAFRDEQDLVTIFRLPVGLERVEAPAHPPPPELAAQLGTLRFAARRVEGGAEATEFSLWSRPVVHSTTTVNGRERQRIETLSRAGEALEDAILALGLEPTRTKTRLPGDLDSSRVDWTRVGPDGPARLQAWRFKVVEGELFFTLLVRVPGTPDEATLEAETLHLTRQIGLDRTALDEWYPSQLRFDAPWRTNILFSIGSSLAFAALVLALGVWRLARIAF